MKTNDNCMNKIWNTIVLSFVTIELIVFWFVYIEICSKSCYSNTPIRQTDRHIEPSRLWALVWAAQHDHAFHSFQRAHTGICVCIEMCACRWVSECLCVTFNLWFWLWLNVGLRLFVWVRVRCGAHGTHTLKHVSCSHPYILHAFHAYTHTNMHIHQAFAQLCRTIMPHRAKFYTHCCVVSSSYSIKEHLLLFSYINSSVTLFF